MRFSFQDPTQPLTEDTGIVEVAPEQKERKEKKKTVVEAGDTTGAPSAAAVTIMNNTTDNQPAVRGTGTHTLQEAIFHNILMVQSDEALKTLLDTLKEKEMRCSNIC